MWQAQGIVHLVKSEQKREGFVAMSKTISGVVHLKTIWKDASPVAGAVQDTHELDVLGDQGGDFLPGLHFEASDLQVCQDDFAWQVQRFE